MFGELSVELCGLLPRDRVAVLWRMFWDVLHADAPIDLTGLVVDLTEYIKDEFYLFVPE